MGGVRSGLWEYICTPATIAWRWRTGDTANKYFKYNWSRYYRRSTGKDLVIERYRERESGREKGSPHLLAHLIDPLNKFK